MRTNHVAVLVAVAVLAIFVGVVGVMADAGRPEKGPRVAFSDPIPVNELGTPIGSPEPVDPTPTATVEVPTATATTEPTAPAATATVEVTVPSEPEDSVHDIEQLPSTGVGSTAGAPVVSAHGWEGYAGYRVVCTSAGRYYVLMVWWHHYWDLSRSYWRAYGTC